MTRHSHQDALDDGQYQRLLEACDQLVEPYRTECKFIIVAGGRLGLRAGEIAHLRNDWINWDREMIEIPGWDPCDKGRGGGRCGYCRKRAIEHLVANNLTIQEAIEEVHEDEDTADWTDEEVRSAALERRDRTNITYDTALTQRWEPKTATSERAVPFGFDEDVKSAVEEFQWKFDRYEHSRVSINRRVARVADAAGMNAERIYPHALRATAATFHAYRGLPAPALQSLMGWSKLSVASKYLRLTGSATAKALNEAHQ